MKDNVMRRIEIEKITLNMGVGQPGDKLDKAMRLLKTISGSNPVLTRTMKRIPTWSLRPKLNIGCKVTLRGKKAEEVLKRLLHAANNKLSPSKFDNSGNFSFGIPEYIDIPGVEYEADIGIVGLEVAVTLKRPGFRIKRRKTNKSKINKSHLITKQDSMDFVNKKFNVTIGDAS